MTKLSCLPYFWGYFVEACIFSAFSFVFAYLSIHASTDDQNAVFGNASDKERELVVEGDDVRFITGISGTNDC